jgi:hypothetical protein
MDKNCSYSVSMFFILPDEKQAPLPVADFDNFKDAMNFYKEKYIELQNDVDSLNPEIWFLDLATSTTTTAEESNGEIYSTTKTKILKYYGNI